MQWQEEALVLHSAYLGESSAVVTVLSETHGLHKGLLKRKKMSLGHVVQAIWTARLPEQLGTWAFDVKRSYSAAVLRDPFRLHGLLLVGELLRRLLTERTPCSDIYARALSCLDALAGSPSDWARRYLLLELFLLSKVGFGLDVRDAILATPDDPLRYVSPRTGRVVTVSKGAPYQEKLLRLPTFFLDPSVDATSESLQEGFILTEYFLETHRLPRAEHPHFYALRSFVQRMV